MKIAKDGVAIARHIHDFLNSYAPAYLTSSACTLKSYADTLSLYITFLETAKAITPGTLSSSCFNRANIEAWLCWLREERSNSIATQKIRLSSIKTFLKYLGSQDVRCLYLYEEAQHIRLPNAPRKKFRV